MSGKTQRAVTLGRAIVSEVRSENVTFMAGSIAYHAFVSLLPLLLLVLAVVSAVGNQSIENSIIAITEAVLTEGASQTLIRELEAGRGSTSVSILGIVILLWGTLRIFRGLDQAFSDIYESEAVNSFADQIADGLVVLVTFSMALVAAAAIEGSLPVVDGGFIDWLVRRFVLTFGLFLVFYPMYYIFPDEDVTYLEVVPGTLLASVGLTAFETLFRYYVQISQSGETSSVLTGILVFLTWLYFSGLVILVGASVNAVLANRSADVNVVPLFGDVQSGDDRDTPGLDELIATVDDLESLLESGDVVVSNGDRELTLSAPQVVITDTDTSFWSPGGNTVGIELRWTPGADGDGGEDGTGDRGDSTSEPG